MNSRTDSERFIRFAPVVDALAGAFLGGEQTLAACVERGSLSLGSYPEWLPLLASVYLTRAATGTRPAHRDVARLLMTDLRARFNVDDARNADYPPEYAARVQQSRDEFRVRSWIADPPVMLPVASASEWGVPVIESTSAVAAWLDVTPAHLDWFAAIGTYSNSDATRSIHHYHYRLTQKHSGGFRLLEAPQPRLKAIQRRIHVEILNKVPNYYNAAHGFVKGRSVRTFALPHVGKRVVVRMDLRDFFPSISRSRVQAVFRTIGYPERVANVFGALCTNVTPRSVFPAIPRTSTNVREIFDAKQLYVRPHLPQGAPTSPALANICAYRMDCRLTGLADWCGATYTRYADDIAFSGDATFARNAERCSTEIAAISATEGWSVQHRKTRIMRRGVRQQLAGVVVNETLNALRADFDTLKAILTNCARLGAASQNRDGVPNFRAHLAGKIAWIASLNAGKGARLRRLFDSITW